MKEISMKHRPFSVLAVIAVAVMAAAIASGQTKPAAKDPKTPDGQPDLQGVWNSMTVTPMERPRDLAGKEFFATEAEAQAYAKASSDKSKAGIDNGIGSYNESFYEFGVTTVKTRRTSFIVDPPDGRVPALTPEAKERWAKEQQIRRRRPEG